MKILVLTPQLPYPPHKGTTIRNLALIRHAASRHDVYLLSFTDEPVRDEAFNVLRRLCVEIQTVGSPHRNRLQRGVEMVLSRAPDMGRRLASQPYLRRLMQMVKRIDPDIVQVEGIELARYIPVIREHSAARILFDEHNCEYRLQQSIFEASRTDLAQAAAAAYSRVQYHRLMNFERWACASADCVTAVSSDDRDAIADLGYEGPIVVLPNGIHMADYASLQRRPALDPPTVVFTGTMDFRPNVDAVTWFAETAWPLIPPGSARFQIVGRTPAEPVRELASDTIEVTGGVPDIRPYLEAAGAMVAPIRMGSGSRLKILEAMAAGVPVVATTIGIAGIDATPNEHFLLADTAEQLAAAVRQTLDDPATAERRALAARDMVRARYDWSQLTPRLDEAYSITLHSSRHAV